MSARDNTRLNGLVRSNEAPLTRLQVRLRAEKEEMLRLMEARPECFGEQGQPERYEQRYQELLEELMAVAAALVHARASSK